MKARHILLVTASQMLCFTSCYSIFLHAWLLCTWLHFGQRKPAWFQDLFAGRCNMVEVLCL